MTEPLDRSVVIDLLTRMGSDKDEEVLESARQAHALVTAAGVSWEELLVPDRSEDDDDDEDYDDEDDEDLDDDAEDQDPVEESPAEAAERNAESLKLIDRLLGKSGTSDALREELEGYKADILDGEFEESDRRYLRALSERLSKGS